MGYLFAHQCFETKQEATNEMCSEFTQLDSGHFVSCISDANGNALGVDFNYLTSATKTFTRAMEYPTCDPALYNTGNFDATSGASLFAFGLSTVILFWVLSKKIGIIVKLVK